MAKTVEVDELELQQSVNARKLLEALGKNPRAKRKFLEAYKEINPEAPEVKELDKPDPTEERFVALQNELKEERKARETSEAKREQDAKIAGLQRAWADEISELRRDGYTAEGVAALEKLRDEKGILSAKDCAAIFEKAHPPQLPITPNGSGAWNFMEPTAADNDDLKRMVETKGESSPLIDKMARDALNDMRSGQPRR